MRIVSLLPSATEILCAIGGRALLVGRSHECDFPPGLDVPVLTAARTSAPSGRVDGGSSSGAAGVAHRTPPSPSAAIDAQVRTLLAQSAPLYTLDTDLLESLRPDLILTQDLCSVCSIDLAAVQRTASVLRARGLCDPQILSLNPHTVEDVLDDLLRVGELVGLAEPATRAVLSLQQRLLSAQACVNPYDDGPVVGFLEWTDPLFIAGHWTVQLIERAGGRHPLNPTTADEGAGAAAGLQQGARKAGKSIAVPPDVFVATQPDWLVIAPCGLPLEDAWEASRGLAAQAWFAALPAVRAGRVAVVDGNQMFNRPGPRLVEAFEWLVSWLQGRPALCPPAFPWRPWTVA